MLVISIWFSQGPKNKNHQQRVCICKPSHTGTTSALSFLEMSRLGTNSGGRMFTKFSCEFFGFSKHSHLVSSTNSFFFFFFTFLLLKLLFLQPVKRLRREPKERKTEKTRRKRDGHCPGSGLDGPSHLGSQPRPGGLTLLDCVNSRTLYPKLGGPATCAYCRRKQKSLRGWSQV